MRSSRRLSRPSFWRLLLCCFFLLSLSVASLSAEDLPDPAQMTDQQIFDELESLLGNQLMSLRIRQENLQALQTKLEESQLQLQELKIQLNTMQSSSISLQSSLSDLSLKLRQTSTELRESETLLKSLSEDMARQSAKARVRETALICVCGISLGAVLVMLVSGFIRD